MTIMKILLLTCIIYEIYTLLIVERINKTATKLKETRQNLESGNTETIENTNINLSGIEVFHVTLASVWSLIYIIFLFVTLFTRYWAVGAAMLSITILQVIFNPEKTAAYRIADKIASIFILGSAIYYI